ncbi:hypothetical protein [Novosphingobium sp. TH158]|nr:hypothetical protein [Novosphingobium sp. TH158]
MARVIALSTSLPQRLAGHDLLRAAMVSGCALALILAGRALPF